MDKRLEEYLDKMSKMISDEEIREESVLEIQNHLLDKADELIQSGLNADKALQKVIQEATNPIKLGRKINMANKPIYLRYPLTFLSLASVILSILTVIILSHYLINDLFNKPKTMTSNDALFKKKFIKDLSVLKNAPINMMRKTNVHSFISHYIPLWITYKNTKTKELKNKLKPFQGWKRKSEPLKRLAESQVVQNLKLEWLNDITRYDHWNYFADGKTKKKLQEAKYKSSVNKIIAVSTYNIPDMILFTNYIKLYVLKLINDKKYMKAELIIDHASELLKTTHSIIGFSSASVLLKYKNLVLDTFSLKTWKRVDEELILALRRIGWGWSTVLSMGHFDKTVIDRWKSYLKPELGMCAGAVEQPLGATGLRDLLYKKFPFESDHKKEIDQSEKFMLNIFNICQLNEFKPLYSKSYSYPKLLDSEYIKSYGIFSRESFSLPINIAAVPYVRRIFAAYISHVGVPRYSGIYFRELN